MGFCSNDRKSVCHRTPQLWRGVGCSPCDRSFQAVENWFSVTFSSLLPGQKDDANVFKASLDKS